MPLIDRLRRRLARKLAPFIGSELAPYVKLEIEARVAAARNEAVQQLREELVAAAEQTQNQLAAAAEQTRNELAAAMAGISERIDDLAHNKQTFSTFQLYRPNQIVAGSVSGEYMRASNALARDFFHPEFREFCQLHNHPVVLDRKLWEWAFIYDRLKRAGVLCAGNRGLVFGVGLEALPSLFAAMGAYVTATDAPSDGGWGVDHAASADQLFYGNLVSREVFDRLVRFEPCDMNDIPPHLNGYDFCWSSCALEHLGSIRHGCDFIINSIEKTLKVGGIACHTTELNLSSDQDTIEQPTLSLYRKSDLERLCATLTERGHTVEPLRIEPGDLPPDYLVDAPPYSLNPHLKMAVEQYVTTSVGIVARRGR